MTRVPLTLTFVVALVILPAARQAGPAPAGVGATKARDGSLHFYM
jgi:hypothetical protein